MCGCSLADHISHPPLGLFYPQAQGSLSLFLRNVCYIPASGPRPQGLQATCKHFPPSATPLPRPPPPAPASEWFSSLLPSRHCSNATINDRGDFHNPPLDEKSHPFPGLPQSPALWVSSPPDIMDFHNWFIAFLSLLYCNLCEERFPNC